MVDGPTATDFVTFNNGLRSAAYDNSLFYRTMNHHTSVYSEIDDLERNRIWLDLINADGMSDRTLIGYVEGATMSRDHYYDAGSLMTDALGIFSVIDAEKFVIQGRALPFDPQDVVPLAVHIPSDGNYKIGIGAVDGLFENALQHIYLEDRTAGIIHNLRQEPYSFDATTGNYEGRFFLRYTDSTLGASNPDAENDITALIKDRQLMIQASQNIESVQLYDVTGKLIHTYSPKEKVSKIIDDFNYADGVYFAKIKLANGMLFTKKLLNK